MSFSTIHNPHRIGTLFYPDVQAISEAAYNAGLPTAESDDPRILFLLVDMQVDFCHEHGTLHVPGANEDISRVIHYIDRHAGRITRILCTLDTHMPYHVFHASWWVDKAGRHPAPLTVITRSDVDSGRWRPVTQPEWSRQYVHKLEKSAEKQLMIWPYHVPQGGVGNILDPELWSCVFWHSIARHTQPIWWQKGGYAKTEHYSAVKPEVISDAAQEEKADRFLKTLTSYDYVIIAGEAASHCVLETVEDIVNAYRGRRELLERIALLTDCTSPVVHPEIDFGAIAEKRFGEFAEAGIRLDKSTEPFPF